jgi:phenylalanyl-tRNA synthetase alpha chain
MTPDERKAWGPLINGLKDRVTEAIAAPRDVRSRKPRLGARLRPRRSTSRCRCASRRRRRGRIHPISQVIDEITAIFADMGFSVAEGPDIETDDYNFTALNFPAGHPAREMHDTFFFNPDARRRAQAAAAHAHLAGADPHHAGAEAADPRDHSRPHLPLRFSDQTHTPMFHQVEGWSSTSRAISAT